MKRLIVLILAMTLVGCAGMSKQEQGATGGAILGIIVGALAGNALDCKGCAAIGGAVGGIALGSAGSAWGRNLDRLDEQQRQQALEIQRSGEYRQWRNPDSGAVHRVAPVKTSVEDGRYCREYIHEIIVAGKKQQGYGKACRKPDGTWEVQ